MHNLVRNQPNTAAVNQAQSTKSQVQNSLGAQVP